VDQLSLAAARQLEMAYKNVAGILRAGIAVAPWPSLFVAIRRLGM
jgi:hypothetical protein